MLELPWKTLSKDLKREFIDDNILAKFDISNTTRGPRGINNLLCHRSNLESMWNNEASNVHLTNHV